MCYSLRWKGASVTVLCKTDSTWHTMVNSKWSEKWPGPNLGTSRNSRTVSSETVVISDEGYAKLRDQVTIEWETVGTADVFPFLIFTQINNLAGRQKLRIDWLYAAKLGKLLFIMLLAGNAAY